MLGMQFLGSYHNEIGNSGEEAELSVLKCPAHDSASHLSLRITALRYKPRSCIAGSWSMCITSLLYS